MAAVTRVLFVIDELDIGGTEQQLLELTKRLDRTRYLPMVCCFRPGRVAAEIQAAGVPVFALTKRARIDLRLVLALAKLMRRERIDLLQSYLFTANTWARLAAILARVPLVVTSERNVDIWEAWYKRAIGTWLDGWTRVTIANSQAVKDYLGRRGLAPEKIQVICNGVDPSRFDEPVTPEVTKAQLGIPPHHAVVGLFARLEPQKDPRTFLQAAAMVSDTRSAVSFLVVGDGSLRIELQQEARELGIGERVIFTGPRRDVPHLLAACDVSVISSLKEGMSNTIMESMAAGKPMVATRVGGNPELIVDGETGFLIRPRDAGGVAAAVGRLLDDPALAKAMGAKGKTRIAQLFSVEAMVEATRRLYDRLVHARALEDRRAKPVPPIDAGPATVALVASQFPRYVDAYFLREIQALAARGIRFRIFSLRGFHGAVVHGAARPFLADTVYVPFLFSWKLLRANVRTLGRMPGRYLGSLGAMIAGCLARPRALVRNLAVFPKSVYFAELVRDEGIRHVHANWASHPATSAWIISRLTGASWSFAGHASDIYIDNAMLREKILGTGFVVTCTRHNREFLVSVAGEAARPKITVSYHGVDLERFRPAPRLSLDRFRILTAGTLRACKGLPDLIEAGRLLARRGLFFECTIVGDGPERASLERLIRRAGLEGRVRITGFLSQEELIPLYQQSSVVALPALSESHFGIPNILLEAFAVGTPVICTPLPSLSEVMEDGRHGLYVAERDPVALADALESLARDPERARRMGQAGRRQVEALFDSDKNATALYALFRSAIEPTSSGLLSVVSEHVLTAVAASRKGAR